MLAFSTMAESLRQLGGRRVAVAAAADEDVLLALNTASRLGIAQPILVGDSEQIKELADTLQVSLADWELVPCSDPIECCNLAVGLVRTKQADAVMKGLVSTSYILKAVLNKETGIREGKLLSHLAMFYVEKLQRFLFLTDPALCIAPTLENKIDIIANAVKAMQLLGYAKPKVGCLCAVEKVNPAMPATLDAAELVRLNRSGVITNCQVGGPFALDNALFPEAAQLKGVDDPIAGQAELLLLPQIEAANILYKTLAFLMGQAGAALVLGAKAPVIVTSRADHEESKLNSIILALYLAEQAKVQKGL